MVDREVLSECLKSLTIYHNTKVARETIETMLKIHRNILYNEEDITKRKIKPNNPVFAKKVWNFYPARQFMLMSGWLEIHNTLVFNCDEKLLDIIEVLVDHPVTTPDEAEWKGESKFEGKSEEQLREEELRRKAAIERQKELEEFMKEKTYRESLAQSIKAQIQSDKNRRKQVYTQPVVGNELVKGAKVKTLNSTPTRSDPRDTRM